MQVKVVNSNYHFDRCYPVVVIGAGACGCCAALAARDQGVEVLLLERDSTPRGNTAMSTGLIPAAGTPEQAAVGIEDNPQVFAEDIQKKSGGGASPSIVARLSEESANTIAWLQDRHEVPLSLVDGFIYPGHSVRRMYGTPSRSGSELSEALVSAVENAGVDILAGALVEDLFIDDQKRVLGVRIERSGGGSEELGCDSLILGCCGFGSNQSMVKEYIPEMANAAFYGHSGNHGHAIVWGKAIGAELADMGAYQGHGGLAHGYEVPILWPMIMQGGFQINKLGERFSDETKGYSEQAGNILRQLDSIAWSILDHRLYELMMEFDNFKEAVSLGAIIQAANIEELAVKTNVTLDRLKATFDEIRSSAEHYSPDQFGRTFEQSQCLVAPFYCVKVTGALFHTQGGLEIDTDARVISGGSPLPNLYAGGGAARGISGAGGDGYIAGNGLLTATSLGKIAGANAASQVKSENERLSVIAKTS